jgi:hypothetical protein
VRFELTRYLPDNWEPVIEREVDGPTSLPARLDGEVDTLGRYAACRRVARTIYLGSAPTVTAAHRGIEDRWIKLGCVMPDESPPVFGDALRHLARRATYLYSDGARYWYAPQPNVTSLAEDRAAQLEQQPERVLQEIERRVREEVGKASGEFRGVHPFPQSSGDVQDKPDARLVILRTSEPHKPAGTSPALAAAQQILEWRGNQPRVYRNTLVFLAADHTRLQDLDKAVRLYLAWESILHDKETLNLDPHQTRTAEQRRAEANTTVKEQILEVFSYLLVPVPEDPTTSPAASQAGGAWRVLRLQGRDPLAVRASQRLVKDALLYPQLGATNLRMELDRIPLWRGDHVDISQLVEDFARYIYLPRLTGPAVLLRAVEEGLKLLTWELDSFAYAESFDEQTGRYRGLRVAQVVSLTESAPRGLLVRPAVARRQLEAEAPTTLPPELRSPVAPTDSPGSGTRQSPMASPVTAPTRPVSKRFFAMKDLDPMRAGLQASEIAKEVIAHLAGLPHAQVQVTMEIHAIFPEGVPHNVERTVTENCRTLKFASHEFHEGE